MKKRIITSALVSKLRTYLIESEKSSATLSKYMRDILNFTKFVSDKAIDKALLLEYKAVLEKKYSVRSVNSMIASLNSFLCFAEWADLKVKQLRIQKDAYCSDDKELSKKDYEALINAAKRKRNERLALVIQTICATGIRVSELEYITVEAVKRGEAIVSCKGKIRKIFIVSNLRKKLLKYASNQGRDTGFVFVTKTGKPLNRSNIWREMKNLSKDAGVLPNKVFPHNLRHLFARTFYSLEKDIAKLADILGHSNINTTRIYIMSTGAEHQRRMENMRLII